MSADFPQSWLRVLLNDVGEIVTGKTPSTKNPDNFGGNIPFIKPADLDNGGYVTRTADTLTDAGAKLVPTIPPNSIPVTCIGNLGKVGITNQTSATNQQINTVVPSSQVDYRFFYYQLQTLKPWMQENASATTVTIINKGKFSKAPVTLPPLAEQKVIADKLDTLLAQVETTKTRLERIPQILKRFRQSVLAAAVSGRLTEEWRERNSHQFPYENRELSEIIHEMRNGLSPKPNEDGRGHPILRISSVRPFSLDQIDIRHLEVSETDKERYSLQPDDLLFTRYNGSIEFVGVCARVSQLNHDTLLYPDKLIRVRVDKAQVTPQFLEIFAASFEAREYIYSLVKSTSGQKGISGKDLKLMKVALPTVSEQTEIVRRVDQLFAHADRIEQQVNNALTRVNNLTQSILAKAFRGELTEQWRKDNPELISGDNSAEALLGRIKAERAAQQPKKKTRNKKPKSGKQTIKD